MVPIRTVVLVAVAAVDVVQLLAVPSRDDFPTEADHPADALQGHPLLNCLLCADQLPVRGRGALVVSTDVAGDKVRSLDLGRYLQQVRSRNRRLLTIPGETVAAPGVGVSLCSRWSVPSYSKPGDRMNCQPDSLEFIPAYFWCPRRTGSLTLSATSDL